VNTRLLMGASALALGTGGLAATFLPQEVLGSLGAHASGPGVALVQLFGAALLGFGFVNWMAKGSLVGGIYSRPIVLGNLVHFASGALTLARLVPGRASVPLLAIAAVYALFAVTFAVILFGDPLSPGPRAPHGSEKT
jgi:hypothetical protein